MGWGTNQLFCCGGAEPEVDQFELEAGLLLVVAGADAEGDVDGCAGWEGAGALDPVDGAAPAEGFDGLG